MNFTEEQVISALASIFASSDPTVEIGIGDDAAVINTDGKTAVTTDMAVEGTHFKKEWSTASEIGKKITVANLADIYAMGGEPRYLVVALCLSGNEELEWVLDLARGIQEQASLCGVSVIGGDLTRGPSVVISITAVGSVVNPVTRSGASAGDSIYISALPGWSAAGLHLLSHQIEPQTKAAQEAINLFRVPRLLPTSSSGLSQATALCDVSDGLLTQAQQIAIASQKKLTIDLNLLAAHPDFDELSELAASVGIDIWHWVLGGGEDHIFLATGENLKGFVIGEVLEGSGVKVPEMKKAPDTWRHFN